MKYSLTDIFDVKRISDLLESYTKATGLVSALLDLDGNILSKSGWQKICTEFHRKNPLSSKNCMISDTVLAEKLEAGHSYNIYKCLNGLIDVAVPVFVANEHVANLFTGQFFTEPPDEEQFTQQAGKYNFDKDKYLEAFSKVPIIKEDDIKDKLMFLLQMTEFIAEIGLARISQLETNKALIKSKKRYEKLNQELKKINEELYIAKEKAEESDHLKSAFLANMSHEIRTPMNSILGFSNLLKKKNLTKEKEDTYLDLIDSGGKRLLNLISDIVDISKIDANQLSLNYEECNLNHMIDNLQKQFEINKLNRSCNIITKKGLKDAESIISIDETRITQILSNLLENALKFTEKGTIEFGYTKENKMLLFFVKDDGIGIDPKNHKSIFERFSQVDNDYSKSGSGTGLGLPIVKSLTSLLNGEVWVVSEKGKGASFYFTIPYQFEKLKEDESFNNVPILKRNEDFTILIAEDEYSNFVYLEALLEEYHFNFLHAENGKDAIDTIEKTHDINLVLMDIKMPVMNGLEATKAIRKKNKSIPIIALTAYAMETDRQKAIEAGCSDYLAKPLSEDKLYAIINKYIEQE
ncbi:MAG: PocR ligand-binding domain-containing protein [Bacteroidota bacterium]|jgi:signal transduction histidine kinase/CheY-like chemotaxis protein